MNEARNLIWTADGEPDGRICTTSVECRGADANPGAEYRCEHVGLFGTYSVDAATSKVTMKIDRATFPNNDDTTQVRAYELKGDILSWRVPARPDGSIPITVLRRIAVP